MSKFPPNLELQSSEKKKERLVSSPEKEKERLNLGLLIDGRLEHSPIQYIQNHDHVY